MATKRPTRSPVSAKKPGAKSVSRQTKAKVAAKPAPRAAARRATRAAAARRAATPPARKRTGAGQLSRVAAAAVALAKPAASTVPPGPSAHDLAMAAFERGFQCLQQRKFDEAAKVFSSIFDAYPDEKELHERGRVYLAICERQAAATQPHEPRTLEERLNAATVALNRGAFEEAVRLLRPVDAANDAVHYMLAVAHAALGDGDNAIPHLRHAVQLNPENRYLALQDADLEPLREHPEFAAAVEMTAPPARRPTTRLRSNR